MIIIFSITWMQRWLNKWKEITINKNCAFKGIIKRHFGVGQLWLCKQHDECGAIFYFYLYKCILSFFYLTFYRLTLIFYLNFKVSEQRCCWNSTIKQYLAMLLKLTRRTPNRCMWLPVGGSHCTAATIPWSRGRDRARVYARSSWSTHRGCGLSRQRQWSHYNTYRTLVKKHREIRAIYKVARTK